MKIIFADGSEFDAQNLLEQKVTKGENSGWVVGFSFIAGLNSETLDELLTPGNTASITVRDGDDTAEHTTLAGYTKVTSAVIRHTSAGHALIELQLSKGI